MSFALATLKFGRKRQAAIFAKDMFWPVVASADAAGVTVMPGGLFEYLQVWGKAWPQIKRLAVKIEQGAVPRELAIPASRARLDTPVLLPRKVFCIGANYQDHLDEMGAPPTLKKVKGVAPFFFIKPGSTAVVGPGPTVHIPARCRDFDWEGEAVAVFGKRGRDIAAKDAMSFVAGYTLAIDFTARDQLAIPDHPFKWNFVLGKCQDAMTPVGPIFVPKEFLNGDHFEFTLSVNGVLKQRASTKQMIYSLKEQIAGVSQAVTIEPGDLMLTGSPAGVGSPKGERLQPGDVVTVESAATGAMQVTIQAALK